MDSRNDCSDFGVAPREDPASRARARGGLGLLLDGLVDEVVARVVEELRHALRSSEPTQPWRLLDLEEAAQRLGRSTRWLRERVKRGDLAYVRLDGGALAFLVDDLEAFARERRIGDETLAGRLHDAGNGARHAASRDSHLAGNQKVGARR
jgi:hypothetical protein